MEGNKIRINFKSKSPSFGEPLNGSSSSVSTIRCNSRSRSRLPVKGGNPRSPSKQSQPNSMSHPLASSLTSPLKSSYRERSHERSSDKLQKSTLYKKENTSLHDIPLLNTSFNNKIKSPEFQQEQDTRGRSRDRLKIRTREGEPDVKFEQEDRQGRGRRKSETIDEAEDNSDEEEDPNMISLMGFGGFGTTKGKHVTATKGGAVKQEKKTEYRQYMNRNKGFNRALSPGR